MPFKKRNLKRLAFKPVRAGINRINFEKIWSWMASFEPGRTIIEEMGPPDPAFPDQEDIINHAIELTRAEFIEKGEPAPSKEIEDYANSISCRYDHEIHKNGRAGAFNVLAHLFEHQDLRRIFISEDKRELRHFDTLKKARSEGVGVLYLVNHSTHFDEFIVDVVLDQLGIHLPLFAAGKNMMATPSLERILMIGSYLIIRKGATKTYLSTLFNYCRALGELGKQQGIFLEAWSGGARTRDGSLRYPRRLVTLQGALAAEKDILVQPVVISYSAVPEDQGLSERAGGLSWVNGMQYFRNWVNAPHRPVRAFGRSLENIFGRSFINFCQPRMLSELNEMWEQDQSDLAIDEYVALYCMKEIARDKKIMASQLTARGLLRARQDDMDDLVAATEMELEDLIEYHRRTFGQDPDLEDYIRNNPLEQVVEDGLATLRKRKVIAKNSRKDVLPEVRAENALQYYATHGDRRLYSPSAKENIVVVGAGAMGYGLASLIGRRTLQEKKYLNSSLTLFDSREDLISDIVDARVHPVYFPKIRLPKNVFTASDATAAFRKATDVLISTPIDFFESDFRCLATEAHQPLNVIIATRGFEQTGHRLPIQIARDLVTELGRSDISLMVLSGPVTPAKLAEGHGGSLVVAGPRIPASSLADLFKLPGFTVVVSDDPIGVQVAGTMVEVYSLLGAYLLRTKEMKGRGQVASFVRETSEEAMTLAVALGGKKESFLPDNPAWAPEYVSAGLGGPGTYFGRQAGRSSSWARDFVQNASKNLREEAHTLTGYYGIRSAYMTAKSLNLKVPRLRQAYRIFYKDS